MKRDDAFKECRLGRDDILDGLTWDRIRQKANEVAGVAGLERHADLTVGFESADAGSMAGARVDDHERPLLVVDLDALGWDDAGQNVVYRTRQLASIHDKLGAEFESMGRRLGRVFLVLLASLLHDVEEQDAPLPGVDPVGPGIERGVPKENGGKGCCLQFGWYLTSHTVPPRNSNRSGGVIHLKPSSPLIWKKVSRAWLAVERVFLC